MDKISLYQDETVKDFQELEAKVEDSPNLIYLKEPNSFSSVKQVENVSQEDLQQVREWKNKVIEIRDNYKGTPFYLKWDLEAKRIVEFLNNFNELTIDKIE